VHLHAELQVVPDRLVRECGDVDVADELAVDPQQQVAVECGGDPERVIISKEQLALGFDEIGAEQKRVSALERSANPTQKCVRSWTVEVTDVGTEQKHQRLPGVSFSRDLGQPDFVGGLMRHDMDVLRSAERATRQGERARRDVNQMKFEPGGAVPPVGADQRRQLLAAARPELDDSRQARNVRENRPPMGREQPHFSARDPIPRQKTNRVEECRSQRVVQIARGKLARLELQVVLDIARESRDGCRLFWRSR
jgi:hypothetical protein